MKKEEYYSRDYDFNEIKIDSRFKLAFKEMIISFVVWFSFAFLVLSTGYYFSRGPVDKYPYIMGIPAWMFCCFFFTLVFYFIIMFITKKVFKNVDLTDEVKSEDNNTSETVG